MLKLYHSTKLENIADIIIDGQLTPHNPSEGGGKAIYFSTSPQTNFGNSIISIEVHTDDKMFHQINRTEYRSMQPIDIIKYKFKIEKLGAFGDFDGAMETIKHNIEKDDKFRKLYLEKFGELYYIIVQPLLDGKNPQDHYADFIYKKDDPNITSENKIRKIIREVFQENNTKLNDKFINHFQNGTGFNLVDVPKEILNKFPNYTNDEIHNFEGLLYTGTNKEKDIKSVKSWTQDEETAWAFSKKHKNGIVIKISSEDFKKNFNFVSMDVLNDYLHKNKLNNEKTDKYYSESEIYVFPKIIREFIKENSESEYITLQRGQNGEVNDEWDFNVVNGQHGKGVYSFFNKDQPMIDYYTKNGENLHTFQIPKKYIKNLSDKDWDFWDTKAFIFNNPQYKAFIFNHKGPGIPSSKEVLITDPSIIKVI